MGNVLKDQEKLEEAIKVYNQVLTINPDYAEAYLNMGNALADQEELEEAIESYKKALSIKPDYAEAYLNMGHALTEAVYKNALSINPAYARAYLNTDNALTDQKKLEEAIESYKKALSIKPDNAETYNNMGVALQEQVKLDEAIKAYTKALSLEPDDESAQTKLGCIHLSQGDLKLFMKHRKWRWTTKEGQQKISHLELPEWDGREPLKGKKVLALGEQGPGDIIMWSPGLEYLKDLGAQVTLHCHGKLIELFKLSFTDIEIKPYCDKKSHRNRGPPLLYPYGDAIWIFLY